MKYETDFPAKYEAAFEPDEFMLRRTAVAERLEATATEVRVLGNRKRVNKAKLTKAWKAWKQAQYAVQAEREWVGEQFVLMLKGLDTELAGIILDDPEYATAIAHMMALDAHRGVLKLMADGVVTVEQLKHAVEGCRFAQRLVYAISDEAARSCLRAQP
jgi:hypothetical protein